MPLYYVQDSDRPLWVIATDWHGALAQWKEQSAIENDGEQFEPEGIQRLCNDDDLLIYGKLSLRYTMPESEIQAIIDNLDQAILYVPDEMKASLSLASAMLVRCECAEQTTK